MKTGYYILLALTIVVTILGIITLIPCSSASADCMLGYKAVCSFTPVSTLGCFLIAGSICKIRKKKYRTS